MSSKGPHMPNGEEAYLRVVCPIDQDRDAVIGIEIRDGDTVESLEGLCQTLMRGVVKEFHHTPWVRTYDVAFGIKDRIRQVFPDRAWFLEVEHNESTWVQIYYPWNLAHPKEQESHAEIEVHIP